MTVVARNDGYSAQQGDGTIREAIPVFDAFAATSPYPPAATAVSSSSGNVANAIASATMPAVASKTNYISAISITGGGATAASLVDATITGLLGGTLHFTFGSPIGVAIAAYPIVFDFDPPIPASAANTAIVLSLPALGLGNTNAAVNINGYVL